MKKVTLTYVPSLFTQGMYTVPADAKDMLNSYASLMANTNTLYGLGFGYMAHYFNPTLIDRKPLKYVYARTKHGKISKLCLVNMSSWMNDDVIQVMAFIVSDDNSVTRVKYEGNFSVFATLEDAKNFNEGTDAPASAKTNDSTDEAKKARVSESIIDDVVDALKEAGKTIVSYATNNDGIDSSCSDIKKEESSTPATNTYHSEYNLCFNNQRVQLIRDNDVYTINGDSIDKATYDKIEKILVSDASLTNRIREALVAKDEYFEAGIKEAEERAARRKRMAELEAELLRLKEEDNKN